MSDGFFVEWSGGAMLFEPGERGHDSDAFGVKSNEGHGNQELKASFLESCALIPVVPVILEAPTCLQETSVNSSEPELLKHGVP